MNKAPVLCPGDAGGGAAGGPEDEAGSGANIPEYDVAKRLCRGSGTAGARARRRSGRIGSGTAELRCPAVRHQHQDRLSYCTVNPYFIMVRCFKP